MTHNKSWIDLTRPIHNGMAHWPGHPDVEVKRLSDMDKGQMANLTTFSFSGHTATHFDAPIHFLKEGKAMESMPVNLMTGDCIIIECGSFEAIYPDVIEAFEADHGKLPQGARVLFKTVNSALRLEDAFRKDYIYISEEAAQLLAERQIGLVGVDYLSVAPFENPITVHEILLGNNIWIIEGLNLLEVDAGFYEMICCPLKVTGADGVPGRVLARAK